MKNSKPAGVRQVEVLNRDNSVSVVSMTEYAIQQLQSQLPAFYQDVVLFRVIPTQLEAAQSQVIPF